METHDIVLRTKSKRARISTGQNVEILIDGEPVRGATRVSVDVPADGLARVTIEMVGQVHVELGAAVDVEGPRPGVLDRLIGWFRS